jgi:hypothetical protein
MWRFLSGKWMVATLTAPRGIGSILARVQDTCIVDVSRPGEIVADIRPQLAGYPELKTTYNGLRKAHALSHTFGNSLDLVDVHFYQKDSTDLYHQFDTIDPACKRICVAEYASSIMYGNGGNVIGDFGDAPGDAVFMLGCERNAERMWWTGYGN